MSASRRRWWLAGLAIAAVVVIAAGLFASGDPDGLQRVAEDQGFLGRAVSAPFELLSDYAVPGLDGPASTVVAGIVGIVVVFGLVVLAGRLLARDRSE